jgi:F0F1-type ATP synthase membrane subunit b/b'
MSGDMITKFVFLTIFVSGVIIFALHRTFVTQIEGAKQRLERDAEAARAREAELNRKIRQADEELTHRRKELETLFQNMKADLEAEVNKQKEAILNKARSDAEDIITKAQNKAVDVRRDVEQHMEMRIIDFAVKVLERVLSQKARAALEKDLMDDFIAQLKDIDMSKISLEIKSADVVTSQPIGDADLKRISEIVKVKIGREIVIHGRTDGEHVSGVVIQFGSLLLDGSLKNAIKESALALKAEVEKGFVRL